MKYKVIQRRQKHHYDSSEYKPSPLTLPREMVNFSFFSERDYFVSYSQNMANLVFQQQTSGEIQEPSVIAYLVLRELQSNVKAFLSPFFTSSDAVQGSIDFQGRSPCFVRQAVLKARAERSVFLLDFHLLLE